MTSLREIAIAYGPVISVVGALILFFSWSVKNTLFQHYSDMKSTIQNAQSTFRLYNTLHELRNSVNSLAMEVVQEKSGKHATRFRSGKTGNSIVDDHRERFDLARLSAHQLKELADFAFKALDLSNSVDKKSDFHNKIISLTEEIQILRDEVASREKDAEMEVNTLTNELDDISFPAVTSYANYWSDHAVKKVPVLYPQIVNASNERVAEAREQLAIAKRYSNWADQAAIFLYVLGTGLAIGGQAVSKFFKDGGLAL